MKILLILLLLVPCIAFGFEKAGTVYTTDGSRLDVANAIADSTPGDTVRVPGNSIGSPFVWGTGGTSIYLNKAITLTGEGMNDTHITIAADSPEGYGAGLIRIAGDGITVKNMHFTNAGDNILFIQHALSVVDLRITGILANLENGGAFYYNNYGNSDSPPGTKLWGSIDGNIIYGDSEMIYTRGLVTAWDTPSSSMLGTNNTLFVEDNDWYGDGSYVTDINGNGMATVRFNRVHDNIKIDGHGGSTNYPKASYRLMEVYENDFYDNGTGIELRGGKNMVFNNRGLPGTTMYLTDYAITAAYYGGLVSTPNNYPLPYAIGTGHRVTINATDMVAGRMYKVLTVGTSNYDLIDQGEYVDINGDTNTSNNPNTVGAQFVATGPTPGTGTVTYTPANDPSYVFNNTRSGVPWGRTMKGVSAAGITLYGSTYTENDLIRDEWDVMSSSGWYGTTYTFDGSRGVGSGPKSAILPPSGIVGTKVGVGFWVEDEAEWNSLNPGNDGQLYTWNGSAWILTYTPAQYPNYLRVEAPIPGTPTAPSALVAADDGIFSVNLSWTDNADNEDSFEVQMSATGAGVGFSTIANVGASTGTGATVTYQATGIPDASTRYFRVRAVNAINSSTWTAEDSARTLTFGHPALNRNPRAHNRRAPR